MLKCLKNYLFSYRSLGWSIAPIVVKLYPQGE
nr:MAG TPA: hypothetical protein [Crassvirales sp.]